MTSAVIYNRVSSKPQAGEDRTSLKAQLRECTEYAEGHGFEVVEVVSEVGTSTSRKRKGYVRVCEMLTSGEADVVIATMEDRLYRGFAVIALLEAFEAKPSATAHLTREVFDRGKMELMAGVLAHQLREQKIRMESGWRERLRAGKMGPGEVLFGYQRTESGFAEVNEDEAAIVQRVFQMYLQEVSWSEVRATLEAQGLHTRYGKPWHTAHLKRLVNQETYHSGFRLYERKAVFEPETFKVEHPQIIDDETWRLAQEKRVASRERYRGYNTKAPAMLRGMVYCRAHNSALQVRRRRMAYMCKRTDQVPEHKKEDCCGYLKIGKVDWAVWQKVSKMILDQGDLEERLLAQVAHLSETNAEIQAEVTKLQRRANRLETERQNTVRAHSRGIITDDDLALQLDELSINQLDIQKRLTSAEAKAAAALDPKSANAQIRTWVDDLRIQIEYGATLARQLTSWKFEDPDDEHIWIHSVLDRYDPDGIIREPFGDDLRGAAKFAVTNWMRSVVQQVVSRIEVDGDKVIHIEYALSPALKLAGLPVLV